MHKGVGRATTHSCRMQAREASGCLQSAGEMQGMGARTVGVAAVASSRDKHARISRIAVALSGQNGGTIGNSNRA